MGSRNDDPLELGGLDPQVIQAKIDKRDNKTKEPSQLEAQKEARLAEKEKRLSAGLTQKKGTSAPSEPPPVAPPPSKEDKTFLLDKLTAYRDRFPHLKKRNNVTAKSTFEEIEDELHFCELQLGSQSGGGNMGAIALSSAMHGLEAVTRDYWNPLGLNLTGLGTVSQQNMAEFQPILDELMIKHGAGMYTSPEWRLALAIGATVITVNAANSNPEMARAMKTMHAKVSAPSGSGDL